MAGNKTSRAKRLALMNKSLEIVAQNPAITYKDICRALGIGECCVGRWYRSNLDGYRDRYDEVLKDAFNELEGAAIKCMADLIKDKNFNAAKYVLDNKGYKAEEKVKAEVSGDIDINITIEE